MKKYAMLIAMLLIATNLYAMASKPKTGTYHWYINEPFTACSAAGNPWVPNNEPKYNTEQWQACAKPWNDYAKACFKWNPAKRDFVKVECGLTDPAK